jgi:hypothetical protein
MTTVRRDPFTACGSTFGYVETTASVACHRNLRRDSDIGKHPQGRSSTLKRFASHDRHPRVRKLMGMTTESRRNSAETVFTPFVDFTGEPVPSRQSVPAGRRRCLRLMIEERSQMIFEPTSHRPAGRHRHGAERLTGTTRFLNDRGQHSLRISLIIAAGDADRPPPIGSDMNVRRYRRCRGASAPPLVGQGLHGSCGLFAGQPDERFLPGEDGSGTVVVGHLRPLRIGRKSRTEWRTSWRTSRSKSDRQRGRWLRHDTGKRTSSWARRGKRVLSTNHWTTANPTGPACVRG